MVLTVKGVQDELNPPGEKGFDILSHQLGRWELSKFPHGFFTCTHVINPWMCNDFNGMSSTFHNSFNSPYKETALGQEQVNPRILIVPETLVWCWLGVTKLSFLIFFSFLQIHTLS